MTSPTSPYSAAPYSAPPARPTNGLAVGALVVGIVAFLIGWVPFVGLIAGVAAVLLGVLALRRLGGRALAIVGLVLGGIAALTGIATTILLLVGVASGGTASTSGALGADDVAAPVAAAATTEPTPEATVAVAAPEETEQAEQAEEAVAKPKAGADYGGYTKTEARFVKIVETASDDYADTTNELKGARVLAHRDSDACALVDGKAKSWVGTVHDVGATGDGDGYVEIEIASNIVVETWNNSLSDAFDDTLISPSASFYDRVADLEEGDRVVFSGRFVASDDSCLDTTNLTKTFNAADPNFLFDFTNIRAQ